LDYQGQALTLVGSFNPNGTSTVTVSRGALPAVSFQLSIGDMDAKNLTITAASTETLRSAGTTGTAWFEQSALSPTTLNASGTLKRTSPASTIASKNFGAVLATFEGTAARTSGHAVLMVSSTGLVNIAGRLGDGSDAAMTASTYLLGDDTAAIYKAIGAAGHLAGSVRLRVVDTASTDNNAVQPADGDWELKTTVARRVRPFGSLYTAPTSLTAMTATTMLGAASATVVNFGGYTTGGATLPAALGSGTWGLRVATVIRPNTSVDDAWRFSGGTQVSTLNAVSEVSLTPSSGSPLRTLSLKVTSSGVASTRSGTGVVLQNDVWQGGVKLPKGTYGVTLNGSNWIEWCVR
jgi:hypothetical protein